MSKRIREMEFRFSPIGILSTPYQSKSGVPIQGVFDPESRGEAEIFEEYAPGLKDIEGFSHLIVIYVFHRSQGYDLVCKPYMEDKLHGVFAIRTPRRPNPIGFSVVRLHEIKGFCTCPRWTCWTARQSWTSSHLCPGLITGRKRESAGWKGRSVTQSS
jgi:tRNA-Thr(GGU) m(6)t(6)A37 methyltransferase TsaA